MKPLTLERAETIHDAAERLFAIAAITHGLLVYFQPGKFTCKGIHGATVPDFLVVNPKLQSTRGKYVEVSKGLTQGERKQHQREIMEKNKIPYVQLWGIHMNKIAEAAGAREYNAER